MSQCPHPDSWFSRTLCAEPCGMMHTYCSQCSECLEYCPHTTSPSALEIVQAQLKATQADYHALVLVNVKLSEQVAFWRAEARRRATTGRSDGRQTG